MCTLQISTFNTIETIRGTVSPHLNFDLDIFLETGKKEIKSLIVGMRGAAQDFGFDEELTHFMDVNAFEKRLEEVRKWHEERTTRSNFLAPLLPVIQSSGTGKSRLLHAVRKRNSSYRSILLTDQDDTGVQADSYDVVHKVNSGEGNLKMKENLRALVRAQCKAVSKAATQNDDKHITLFFDEAQHLTTDDGYLFRVLRWIIRQRNFRDTDEKNVNDTEGGNYKITVVLAGTNSKLANFFPEVEHLTSNLSSRYLTEDGAYYEEGKEPFQPFFTLRTQGCLSQRIVWKDDRTEYQNMVRFSRPLFALLYTKNKLDQNTEFDIALKIVLSKMNWITDQRSCLSVLATRVQMGSTNTSVVSDLVSKGYAHLTFFQNKNSIDSDIPSHASFAFLPDPVCARIAMCLMDEDFEIRRTGNTSSPKNEKFPIKGQQKTKVVEMMGRIFSGGMCLPAKGDFGEVAVALYLLFCGDILRKDYNVSGECYEQLSVDFYRWMTILWGRGKKSTEHVTGKNDDLAVNCIQFFRFSFGKSMAELAEEPFLKSLYEKGCAIYCSTNTEAIDLVIPCYHRGNKKYIPIFVSIKNYGCLYPGEATKFLEASTKALDKAGIKKGLLLLGVAGQDRTDEQDICSSYEQAWIDKRGEYSERLMTKTTLMTQDLSNGNKVHVGFFCVHQDDFGINDMLKNSSFVKKKQTAEVYCMHSELIHGLSTPNEPPNNYREDAKEFFRKTFECIKKKE